MDIAIVNKATVKLPFTMTQLIDALQEFVDEHFGPVWGKNAVLDIALKPPKNTALMLITDTADVADALGYHDVQKNGYPVSNVFAKTTLDDKQDVCVTASHELAEMLVDPSCRLWAQNGNSMWAYETADAVEETWFLSSNGQRLTNFVTEHFFEGFRKSGQFDFLNKLHAPFSLLPGGYSIISKGGKVSQIFGSKDKAKRFKKEDRRLHRSEYRSATK